MMWNVYALYFSSYLAVKVQSDIGYLVLAFRRVEFFLQVFMTDFQHAGKVSKSKRWVYEL